MAGWSLAAALLLLPAMAMEFSDEVHWTPFDFVVAGLLIGGVGLAFELAVRRARSPAYRAGVALALAAAFLLIWINAAVGIIGDEGNPLNLLYAGVLGVAFIGATTARYRADGLARAMIAAAVAQALVGVLAFALGGREPPGPMRLAVLNGFFVLLFAGAAGLFRTAGRSAATCRKD